MIGTRTRVALGATVAAAAALLLSNPAGAQDDFKVEDGYTSLFNGKDLTGWKLGQKSLDGATETPNKKWHVTDGAIVIDGGGGGDIYTQKDFSKSFHLKIEFRASLKSDSGLYVRGPQLQVRDFIRRGEQKALAAVFKNDGWNELDITVGAPVTVVTVNGKALAPADVFELTVRDGKRLGKLNGGEIDVTAFTHTRSAVTVCKLNGEVFDKAFKAGAVGGIGLQSETGKFEFRRIRIKEME